MMLHVEAKQKSLQVNKYVLEGKWFVYEANNSLVKRPRQISNFLVFFFFSAAPFPKYQQFVVQYPIYM